MKHSIYHILLATTAAGLLGACATHRQAAEPVTATPAPCLLTPDSANRARMDLTFHIPENTFNRRTRLVITPQLLVGDSVAEARQVLDAFADTLPCLANAKAALYVRTDELARAAETLIEHMEAEKAEK